MARQAAVPIRFATYGDERYAGARERIGQEARGSRWFNAVSVYTPETLTPEYKASPFWDMRDKRGGGYWAWKFDVLRQELKACDGDGIVVYADAGCTLNPRARKRFLEYVSMVCSQRPGIVSFEMQGLAEEKWTTEEVFTALGVGRTSHRDKAIRESGQLLATVLIIRNGPIERGFIEECWNLVKSRPSLITDDHNDSQDLGFEDHRHDQSVMSVVRKLRGPGVVIPDETWIPQGPQQRRLASQPFWATRRQN